MPGRVREMRPTAVSIKVPQCPNGCGDLTSTEEVAGEQAPPGSLSWFPGHVLTKLKCPRCPYRASLWRDWDAEQQRPVRK